jgi:uncharacterized protein YhaN
MQFHTDHQTDFDFKFTEHTDFNPEYLPEIITPYFINKSVISTYSKKSKLGKFFSLPKVSSFVLESLEKSNEFSLELHSLVKQAQSCSQETRQKVDKLNERFSALEGRIHLMTGELGDFQQRVQPILNKLSISENSLDEKIRKLEANGSELKLLKQEIASLKNRDKLLWLALLLSVTLNSAAVYYLAFS